VVAGNSPMTCCDCSLVKRCCPYRITVALPRSPGSLRQLWRYFVRLSVSRTGIGTVLDAACGDAVQVAPRGSVALARCPAQEPHPVNLSVQAGPSSARANSTCDGWSDMLKSTL